MLPHRVHSKTGRTQGHGGLLSRLQKQRRERGGKKYGTRISDLGKNLRTELGSRKTKERQKDRKTGGQKDRKTKRQKDRKKERKEKKRKEKKRKGKKRKEKERKEKKRREKKSKVEEVGRISVCNHKIVSNGWRPHGYRNWSNPPTNRIDLRCRLFPLTWIPCSWIRTTMDAAMELFGLFSIPCPTRPSTLQISGRYNSALLLPVCFLRPFLICYRWRCFEDVSWITVHDGS